MQRQQQVVGTFEIAGIPCRVECRDHGFSAFLSSRYTGFAWDAPPQVIIQVEITEVSLEKMRAGRSGPFARLGGRDGELTIEGAWFRGAFHEKLGQGWIAQPPDPAPVETFLTAICAGRLLRKGGFLLHAAAILADEGAYVFFGPSSSGKTTVAELIEEGVITDEIAAIRRDGSGYLVSALPWRGKRVSAPLAGLFRLRQARETAFTRLSPVETVRQLLPCVFFSRADASELGRFLEIGGDLVKRVPCYEMHFAPDGSFWDSIPRRRLEEIHGLSL